MERIEILAFFLRGITSLFSGYLSGNFSQTYDLSLPSVSAFLPNTVNFPNSFNPAFKISRNRAHVSMVIGENFMKNVQGSRKVTGEHIRYSHSEAAIPELSCDNAPISARQHEPGTDLPQYTSSSQHFSILSMTEEKPHTCSSMFKIQNQVYEFPANSNTCTIGIC